MPDTPTKRDDYQHAENFRSDYANNVQFESASLDLTLVFGKTQPQGPVRQHTAITIAWPYAKLLLYYLQANIALWESINGKAEIPKVLLPKNPAIDPQIGDQFKEVIQKVYEEFLTRV